MVNLASSINARNKFLIFGGGFSGDYFAKEIRKHGCIALTSSRSRKDDPNSFIFDSERNLIPDHDIFDGTTHILSCIPPTKEGLDPVLQKIKKKIERLSPKWVGYLSTTGVYGDANGDWVSETDKPNPIQLRSKRRLLCEQEWQNTNLPIQIFRLPGIYGPGRSTLESINEKKVKIIHKSNQVFSRIHVADIANAIIYILKNKNILDFHQIINISDNKPCSQIEVIKYSYKLMGLKMPKPIDFEDATKILSPMAQSFWMENRRVSNKLLCNELGYKLIYESYKKGLKDCLLNFKIL